MDSVGPQFPFDVHDTFGAETWRCSSGGDSCQRSACWPWGSYSLLSIPQQAVPKPPSSLLHGLTSSVLSAKKDQLYLQTTLCFCLRLFPPRAIFTKMLASLMILSAMPSMQQLLLFPAPKESWCKCSKLWESASSIWKPWTCDKWKLGSDVCCCTDCQHPSSTSTWQWE